VSRLPISQDNVRGFTQSFMIALLAVVLYFAGQLSGLEERLGVDFRLKVRGERAAHPAIAIIAVDEPSIDALGRWPWDRDVHAKLIERLTAAGAKAIAFDVLFTEPDQCGRSWADEALGRAASKSGKVVFGCLFHNDPNLGRPVQPLWPIKALLKPGVEVGVVNIFPELDGVTRRVPLVIQDEEGFVPTLALAAFALAEGKPAPQVLDELQPPLDDSAWHELMVDYVGGREFQRFPYHSFVDVLKGKVPADAFKDKIVLVGGTAVGLFDFKSVPNIANFPGVEIHANVLDNLLQRRFLKHRGGDWDTVLMMLVFGALCGFLALKVPTWSGVISAGLLLGYFVVGQELFSGKQVVINYVGPAFGVVFSYLVMFFIRFRRENREKRWIRGTFAQYMSPKIVDAITKNPDLLRLGGEDREMTVFFSDIVGFTSIAETMTPQELVKVLNEYLTEMSNVVFQYGGVVDKYIGDAIMAFWNAPIDQPDHAVLACLTALDQVEKLKDVQRRFAERKLPHIDFRVGINTGHMVVGNMGSLSRFDYTAMGDAVNMASRLEGANKPFHTRIMVSEFTYEKAKEQVEVRPLDWLRVKGKSVPIQVYELAARKGALTPQQKKGFDLYGEGLALYREKKFKKAIDSFKAVLQVLPDDGPSKAYLARCDNFIAFPPPPEWDGVYVMTTK
jgi:adenylate cyclase